MTDPILKGNAGYVPRKASLCFVTLGCAKNEVDTRDMKQALQAAGYDVEADIERADAIVINTCSFIQAATEESIEAVLEAAELPRVASGAVPLIVAGCMPARYGAELEEEFAEVSAFVPCSAEEDIVAVLNSVLAGRPHQDASSEDVQGVQAVQEASEEGFFAYVKIADGCDRFCSYCTIPFIRGRYHSFAPEKIEAEVASCVAAGAREIILIAQDTGRYGHDLSEPRTLAWLLERLATAFPDVWFRVMYIQPEGIDDELLDCVASHANICSYFDIPLQHVDEDILSRMNRKGSRRAFERLIAHITERIPDVSLRTTLLCGFPGETEAMFDDLCDFVEEAPFDYIGVFAYSREEGTAAYSMEGHVDDDEKASRAQRLRDTADAACSARIAERIGRRMDVLVEGCEEDGQLFGRAQCQAPEIDGVTYLEQGVSGEVRSVRIIDTLLYEMEGE